MVQRRRHWPHVRASIVSMAASESAMRSRRHIPPRQWKPMDANALRRGFGSPQWGRGNGRMLSAIAGLCLRGA